MREKVFYIFLGQSLTEFAKPLMTLGVKKGSKVMLIGKKVSEAQTQVSGILLTNMFLIQCLFNASPFQFDPLEEENMKKIFAAEKMADGIEKRLTEHQEEVSGIEKVTVILLLI